MDMNGVRLTILPCMTTRNHYDVYIGVSDWEERQCVGSRDIMQGTIDLVPEFIPDNQRVSFAFQLIEMVVKFMKATGAENGGLSDIEPVVIYADTSGNMMVE